jgi:hypothetical protein
VASSAYSKGAAPVTSGRGLVASSFQYYLTGDESLRVETISNNVPFAVVDVGARLWREDDRAIIIERERHVCSPPALSQKDYALPAGALLNLRLSTTTAAAIFGRLFVRAQLIRGFGTAATWSGRSRRAISRRKTTAHGRGRRSRQMHDSLGVVVNPGFVLTAGPSLQMTVPAGVRYRVIAGHFVLIAATAVAGIATCSSVATTASVQSCGRRECGTRRAGGDGPSFRSGRACRRAASRARPTLIFRCLTTST